MIINIICISILFIIIVGLSILSEKYDIDYHNNSYSSSDITYENYDWDEHCNDGGIFYD